ncbi:MAG: hypothetical protein JWQ97_1506 [Phenylobacterium sp.]|nr:hypothetical protein [Phenylobacterium sp.]
MTPLEMEVTAQARGFETMRLEELRDEWRRRYGAPPTLRSPDLLRYLLAWRVQAQALGGLDAALVRAIRHWAGASGRRRAVVPAGSLLAREWQGKLHEVAVVEGGFEHEGHRYKSLSAVARAITGVRWNGPRFFGLRDAAEAA